MNVSNLNSSGDGSLTYAINALNADSVSLPNTITFSSGLSGTIDLTTHLPEIAEPLDIEGPGANVLTLQENGSTGIFDIEGGLSDTTEISGLTLTGGDNTGKYGAVGSASPLALTGDNIVGNTGGLAGGVYADDGLILFGSTISGNTGLLGGGVLSFDELDMKYSTVANNTATYDGGGIAHGSGALSIDDSTIAGNRATGTTPRGLGGGIYLQDSTTSPEINDTIVSGDTAATSGPDVYTESGTPTVTTSFSLFGSLSGSGISPSSSDLFGVNPLLGPLQNNGGTTPTMAPAYNSPVINQGNSESETEDQRGEPRPADLPGYPVASGGDGSDIGAVELQPSEVLPAVTGLSPASGVAGTPVAILGSRLLNATQVLWGSTPVPFTTNTSGELVVTAPAGTGTVGVRVITPGGESAAVAADQFTYTVPTPTPTPTPTPSPTVTSAKFDNQEITLVTPSACTASTSSLSATLASTAISGSHATKLKFSSAGFFIDKGIKHTKKKTEHLKNGKTKHITVTTYSPNTVAHHVPDTVLLSLKGVSAGSHTLKIVVSYKETVTKHGHKKTETVTKTISSKFTVC